MIYIRQGNDYLGDCRIVLTFTDRDTGLPIDITGFDVWFAVKERNYGGPDADALVLKSTADDVEIDADQVTNKGIAYVSLTNVETADIPVGVWWYSAQGKDGTDRVIEVGPSRATVEADFITATV